MGHSEVMLFANRLPSSFVLLPPTTHCSLLHYIASLPPLPRGSAVAVTANERLGNHSDSTNLLPLPEPLAACRASLLTLLVFDMQLVVMSLPLVSINLLPELPPAPCMAAGFPYMSTLSQGRSFIPI